MTPRTRGKDMPGVAEPQRLPTLRSTARQRDMENASSEASYQSTARGTHVRTSFFHTSERGEPSLEPSQQMALEFQQMEHSSTSTGNSTRRGRGRAKQIEGWGKQKLICKWNDKHQPLGIEGRKLNTQLGNFARNGYRFPLTKTSWDGQDPGALEAVWNEVKRESNQEPINHISMWRHTRKVKDKSGGPSYFTQDDGAADIDAQFEIVLLDLPKDERENPVMRDNVFRQVVGEDGHGRVHMMGVGITPSSLRSDSSSTANNYNARLQAEVEKVQKEFEERDRIRAIEFEKRMKEVEQRHQEDIARLQENMARVEESLVQKFMAFSKTSNTPNH